MSPIFFDTTIDSETYCDIIYQFIALSEPDEQDVIFQQDRAYFHTLNVTMEFLTLFFPVIVLSHQACGHLGGQI